jgi:hypothetical protein
MPAQAISGGRHGCQAAVIAAMSWKFPDAQALNQ